MNHDELYVRFAEVWPELLTFIRTGRFSDAANRHRLRRSLTRNGMTRPHPRPATRDAGWAKAVARGLGRAGVRPNSVSVAGLVFAGAACGVFCVAPDVPPGIRALALLVAAAAIQLRLLCNLLDGMLAVEEGF